MNIKSNHDSDMSFVSGRKKALKISQAIISLEHGYMSDESLIAYNYWLSGEWPLNKIRITEFGRFMEKELTNTIIRKNRLNLSSDRVLNLACSSIVCSRLLELSTVDIAFEYTVSHLRRIHKALYNDIYPSGGNLRSNDICTAEPLLSFHNLHFAHPDYICNHLSKLLQSLAMEDDNNLQERYLCDKLAYFCSGFYYCQPFSYGNILLIIYTIIKWAEQHHFDFMITNILKYNDNNYLQHCIALGAYTIANRKNLPEIIYDENLSLLSDLFYKIHGGKEDEANELLESE